MSSSFLQKNARTECNLDGVLDIAKVMKDLARLREETGENQIEFELRSGVTRWSIQAIESGKGPLHVEDLQKWLEACDLTLPGYLAQFMSEEDKAMLAENAELFGLFRRALRIKRTKDMLKLFLPGLFPVVKRRGKKLG